MARTDEDEVQDQVVAQADDEDFDDEDEDFDDEDEQDDDEDSEDDVEAAAVLKEIEIAEQNHQDAIAEYNEVVAGIRQRQIDNIKQLSKTGIKVADIAKVYPRKLVNEATDEES